MERREDDIVIVIPLTRERREGHTVIVISRERREDDIVIVIPSLRRKSYNKSL